MTIDSRAWAAEHSAALVGLPAGAAEQEVAEAGLRSRIAGPGEMLTLEFRPERITLQTDADGVVLAVLPG